MPIWKRMSSGAYIDFDSNWTKEADISDVETSLNYIYRFTGHHKDAEPLTVAQHSLLCLKLAETTEPNDCELHLAVFTHDFAEAYIGDVSTPVKRALGARWTVFAVPIEQSIEQRFYGSLVDPEMHDRVKVYDLAALDIERRVLWSSQYGKDKWPENPLPWGTLEDKRKLFASVQEVRQVPVKEIWKDLYDKVYG